MHTRKRRNLLTAFIFIAPFLILYLVFTIAPMVYGFYVSLHRWGLMGKQGFIGLDNYQRFFSDRHFISSLLNTLKYIVLITPGIILLSLGAALLANRQVFGQKFIRIGFYLPTVLSVTVMSYIVIYFFRPYTGVMNNLLQSIGLLHPQEEIMWIRDVSTLWGVLSGSTIWWTLGGTMLLYLAALQDIPKMLYEAASIDGATSRQSLWHITLPMLRPITYLNVLLQIMASFKIFGQVHLISGGGPGTATRPLVLYIYQQGFVKNQLGHASAMSMALFLVIAISTLIQLKIQARGESYV